MRSKCILFLLILLLSPSILCWGQDSVPVIEQEINHLNQLIEKHAKEDEEMVRLLNEYARKCFQNLEFKQGLIATRDGRILSEKLRFEGGRIMYYQSLASYFGDGSMNNYYQKQAQWLSASPGLQLSNYYEDLPKIDYGLGPDFRAIIEEFTLILDHFRVLDDTEIQACLLSSISEFNYYDDNMEENLRLVDKVIDLYTSLKQPYPTFLFKTIKRSTLDRLGRTREAEAIEADLIRFVSNQQDNNYIGLISISMATSYSQMGRNALAIEYFTRSISIFEQTGDLQMLAETYNEMGRSYELLEMYDKATDAYMKHLSIIGTQNDSLALFGAYNKLIMPLYFIKRYDDARKYMSWALRDTSQQNQILFQGRSYSLEGQIRMDSLQYAQAIPYFQNAYRNYLQVDKRSSTPFMLLYMAECYFHLGNYNAAIKNALQSLEEENALNYSRMKVKRKLSLLLSEIYDALGQQKSAFAYLKMHQKINSESDRLDEANRIADTEVRSILERSQTEIDQLETQKIQKEQQSKIQRIWIISITGALLSALIIAIVLFRNNKNKQKANELLEEQKKEIQETLRQLKLAQAQLIQSEKMASLGELTAGIAHEIQNPLNFVNNFSEVSNELLDEMNEELDNGDFEEAKEISSDLKQNLEKINLHGQRASGIVKGMLEHSRKGDGKKEPTDINKLADEYLRLAYHGIRAKDKSFNADFQMDFDESLSKVDLVPQDIGRVLLNLINNAFYAVASRNDSNDPAYSPTVVVSTKRLDDVTEIKVTDNGSGIPEEFKEKIFQPFFTTKPTGKGTGLGLSLVYDIIKVHGGTISLESTHGEGSEFTIQLPNS